MDVVVVGGGVVGLCSALALARRGASVTILEAGEIGTGPSATNAGWIVPSLAGPVPAPGLLAVSLRWLLRPDSPLWIRPRLDPAFLRWLWTFRGHMNERDYTRGLEATLELAQRTMERFDALEASGVHFEMHRDGVVLAYSSVKAFEAGVRELSGLGRFGFAATDPSTGGRVRDLDPALGPGIQGAFVVEGERHVDPLSFTAAVGRELERIGVSIRRGAEVRGFRVSADRVSHVETADDAVKVDAVLIAAGAATGRVTGMLGARLPVEAGKGYAVDMAPRPLPLRRPVYLHEERIAVTPLSDRLRLAGTMELGARSEGISTTRVRSIERGARRLLDGWSSEPVKVTYGSGMRPVTPDGLPIIGPLPRVANAWVASGHAMMGLTLGPATADAVTEGITTGTVPEVVRPFLPERFLKRR